MKTQFFKVSLLLLIFSGIALYWSCSKDPLPVTETEIGEQNLTTSGFDVGCPPLVNETCPSPCQSNCSALNNLFGSGSAPGTKGAIDIVINCRNPKYAISPCEIPCPDIVVQSGLNGAGWIYDSGCVSLFNNFKFPLCNVGNPTNSISIVEQEQIITDAINFANANLPSGCNYVVGNYDLFWVRQINPVAGCGEDKVRFVIGVKVTYVPLLCAG